MFEHGLLGAIVWGAMLGLFVAVLRWLLTRRGKPSAQGDLLRYKPRPGIRILGLFLFLMGAAIWAFAMHHFPEGGWNDLLWLFLFSLFPVLLAALVVLQQVTMDPSGLHFHRALLPSRHIPWENLSHYEINASAITSVILFRPRTGRQTIALSGLAYNATDLIDRVTQRSGIARQTYRRRGWSGS